MFAGNGNLTVVIEYRGEKPVELPKSVVPWEWPYAITACAVPVLEFLILPCSPKRLTGDPPKGYLTVKPGENLKGTIPLRILFDRWDQRRFEGPVIVFWSYNFQTSNRVGGWLKEHPQGDSPSQKESQSRQQGMEPGCFGEEGEQ